MVDRLVRIASRALLAASAIALALMMGILCWQVLARYLFDASPAWAEQSALLLMIWMTFLGTASGVADGFHIRIAEGIESLPANWRLPAVQLANALIIVTGLLMLVYGLILAGGDLDQHRSHPASHARHGLQRHPFKRVAGNTFRAASHGAA